MDRGLLPAKSVGAVATPRLVTQDGVLSAEQFASNNDLRLTRAELISASNLSEDQLTEIESYGLISIRGRHYDNDALAVAKAVSEISAFGIGARHLRAFKTAADREIGLVEQVTTPLLRQKGAEAAARAQEVERELASLSIRLHTALVRSGLHRAK
jgi:hypothetical protein